MAIVLITGMSGVGKSTVIDELRRRGHHAVDTDYGGFAREIDQGDGPEQLWNPDRITTLLSGRADEDSLFIAGTVSNQGTFYSRFDAVALLTAPVQVMLDRLALRTANTFGQTDRDRERVLRDTVEVLPRLRRSCTLEIDTVRPVNEVADAVESAAKIRDSTRPQEPR